MATTEAGFRTQSLDNRVFTHVPCPRRKPLVDYCTNEWRNNLQHAIATDPSSSVDNDDYEELFDRLERYCDNCLAVMKAPRFTRLLLITVFLITLTSILYVRLLQPWLAEERETWMSVNSDPTTSSAGGLFGSNVRPQFQEIIQIAYMNPKHLPRPSKMGKSGKHDKRRLIFVGDIHGCKKELVALLEKVRFDSATDHLIAAGDMISKGPDSLGVIDLLRGVKASCVRGNHEDRVLSIINDLKSSSVRAKKGHEHEIDRLHEQPSSRNEGPEKRLARTLSADQLDFLRNCPLILRVGEFRPFGGEIVVVHAGLVPGLSLDHQDPVSVMNMRIIDLGSHIPSRDREREGSIAWYKLWNKYQKLLPTQRKLFGFDYTQKQKLPSSHTTVIYGHDSKRGLQLETYTKGLDTGCVGGGKLTALVLSDGGKQEIVQVDCKDYKRQKAT